MKAEVTKDGIMIAGKPVHILSGEMHYFRIHPDYWRDRLTKLKACGLNSVATYMPWNLHEPRPGTFVFDGFADVETFVALAGELGLHVFLRPGPYICSEWEFGGLPSWLLKHPGIRLRCSDPTYLEAVKRYFDEALDRLSHLFCNNDGPIVAIQIENGYASFGNDIAYVETLRDWVRESGFEGIIFSADGDSDTRISTANINDVWKTLMLGENPMAGLGVLEAEQPDLPRMITEFWDGQGMRVGLPCRLRDTSVIARNVETVLEAGGHLNLYMFHGGTTFGFMNGGLMFDYSGKYEPFVTSYDTQAPLSEAGDPTPKYFALREVISKFNPEFDAQTPVPPASEKRAYGKVELTACAPLRDNLAALTASVTQSPHTLTMEEVDQNYGFILYRTHLRQQKFRLPLSVKDVRDRAWVFLDGKRVGSLHRNGGSTTNVTIPEGGATLDILVENMGRYSFFWHFEDNRKGITRGVVLNNQQFQHDWEIISLPLDDLSGLAYGEIEKPTCPAFFSGTLTVDTVADTFLQVAAGKKGVCWINGFNLGRYDNQGPQHALYVPAPLLKKGENRVEILELDGLSACHVDFLDTPRLPPA